MSQNAALETITTNPIGARNFSILTFFPIYKRLDPNEKTMFSIIMKWFENMSFQIGITDKDSIITSDNPVYIFKKDKNYFEHVDLAMVPLTSKLVLYMRPYETTNKDCKNMLFTISDNRLREITKDTILYSKKWLYSKNPLTKQQIAWIDKVKRS